MTDPAPPPPTKAAIVQIEIAFREVEAMYQLYDGRRIVGTPEQPVVVYDARGLGSLRMDAAFEDEWGQRVKGVKTDEDMTGVYQAARIYGHAVSLRTFSRKRAGKINEKWVYVFTSETKSGDKMKLATELAFTKGDLQIVDLAKEANKDTRAPSGDRSAKLYLTLQNFSKDKPQYFWFLLTPYQLPWAALDEMAKSGQQLASRCHRLFDEFWTDGSQDGGEAKTFWELDLKSTKAISFVLYLVDPFKEALRLAALYQQAVGVWSDIAASMGKDEEYVLAKKLENLPKEYVDVVWPKLGPWLAEKEKALRLLLRVTVGRLEDLVQWIGDKRKRDSWLFASAPRGAVPSDTWFITGGKATSAGETKEDLKWGNPFSELVRDYNQATTPDEIQLRVGELVSAVHERLGDLPRGQDHMKKVIDADFRGEREIADAGGSLLFESRRKGGATSAEIAGGMLKHYAPTWVTAYRDGALAKMIQVMKDRHKIVFNKGVPRSVRRAEQRLANKAFRKAEKKGIEKLAQHFHLEVDPVSVRTLKLTEKALNRLMVGVEILNMRASIQEMIEQKDLWAAVGLMGSSLDAFLTLSKIYPRLEEASVTLGGLTKAVKVAPILAILSSAIDVATAGRALYNATNFGQQVGYALRTFGAALTVGGAVAARSGPQAAVPGIAATIIGLFLQAVGNWIASEFDDLKQFLRHTQWGERSGMDTVFDKASNKNNFGYKGDLASLSKDVSAQHRALDWLLWVFKPDLKTANLRRTGDNFLYLELHPPKGLGPYAKWSAKLEITQRGGNAGVIKSFDFKEKDDYDQAALSANEPMTLLEHHTPDSSQGPSISQRYGDIKVKGEIQLDVIGDGSSVVVRQIDEDFELPW